MQCSARPLGYSFPLLLCLLIGLGLGWAQAAGAAALTVQASVAAPDVTIAVQPDPVIFDTVSRGIGQRLQQRIVVYNRGNVAFRAVHVALDPASLAGSPWAYAEATDPSALDDRTIALNVRHEGSTTWHAIPPLTAGQVPLLPGELAAGQSQAVYLALLVGPDVTPGTSSMDLVIEVTH